MGGPAETTPSGFEFVDRLVVKPRQFRQHLTIVLPAVASDGSRAGTGIRIGKAPRRLRDGKRHPRFAGGNVYEGTSFPGPFGFGQLGHSAHLSGHDRLHADRGFHGLSAVKIGLPTRRRWPRSRLGDAPGPRCERNGGRREDLDDPSLQ